MITMDHFIKMLPTLGFAKDLGECWTKPFDNGRFSLVVDCANKKLIYPDEIKVNEHQTCNFSENENFVVFECVHRLLSQGYKPEHIEIEHPVKVGHGASGGRLDIWVKDNSGSLLIIECKTAGKEFVDAFEKTLEDGGQLFSYAHALDSKTQFVALYASDWKGMEVLPEYRLISLKDNEDYLSNLPKDTASFKAATTLKQRFYVWSTTYKKDFSTRGLFESDIAAYIIGKTNYCVDDLKEVDGSEIRRKYHEFATILRQHNVSGHENAFDKLVNLFLAKIVDENINPNALDFYWKGAAYDDVFSLTDRLQRLYKRGMEEFLKETVTYIDRKDIDHAFRLFKKDATKQAIQEYFRQLKYFTNNDFAFIDVHNEKLFHQNAEVLLKIVQMLQDIRLQTQEQHQFLGDLFEGFLDRGVKQSEGQFFTPIPIVRFLISSLPLEAIVANSPKPPRVIDYACGAGHFLNEYCQQVFSFVRTKHSTKREDGVELVPSKETFQQYYAAVTGIDKEYRLSKVSKVSASMYGQDEIRIVYADALASHPDVQDGSYSLLVANPPYSVKGFLETLSDADRKRYELMKDIGDLAKSNSIETFFVERAKQLLAPGGVAAIILPSSILSNTGIYTHMREILIKYFDIVAIAEFGSGTFGKTGTNTATLFLRRKAVKPDLAEHYKNRVDTWFDGDFSLDAEFEDAHLLSEYCVKIGIPLEDYKTLLNKKPCSSLLEAEIFEIYRKKFDTSAAVKRIRGKRLTSKYSETDCTAELEKAWFDFLCEIEKEKLYFFMLATSTPQSIVLVKSPTEKNAIKTFLGYEWSTRKGDEGIKYIGAVVSPKDEDDEDSVLSRIKGISKIKTPLFNPSNPNLFNDPLKINFFIRAAFNGDEPSIPSTLEPYVSRAPLADLLDFTRATFDKAFKTNVPVSRSQSTLVGEERVKNGLTVLRLSNEEDFDISIGRRVLETDLDPNGKVPIYSANVLEPFGFFNSLLIKDFSIPSVLWGIDGDWMVNFVPANQPFYPTDHCGVIRVRTDKINPHYLAYALKLEGDKQRFSRTLRASTNRIKSLSLCFPDKGEQDRIVGECEVLDAECDAAKKRIEECQSNIAEAFEGLDSATSGMKTLQEVCEFNPSKSEIKSIPDATNISFVEMSSVSNEGYILDKVERPIGTLRKGSYTNFRENDILIAKITPCMENGKCFIAKGLANGLGMGSSEFHVVRASKDVNVQFIFYYLNRAEIRKTAEKQMTGASGHRRVPEKFYRDLRIPYPSPAEQERIVSEIEGYEEEIASARAVIIAAPARRRAILEKWLR